jgi:uncharacterized protein
MTSHPRQQPPAARWKEWAWLFCLNGLFTSLLSLGYILGVPSGLYGSARWSLPMAVVSQGFFLNLGAAVLSAGIYLLFRWRLAARILSGAIYVLIQVAVVGDIIVFRLFHRHFDGVIWGVITTEGVGDSVRMGTQNYVIAAVLIALITAIVVAFSVWLAPRLSPRRVRHVAILVLACILWERTVYAAWDFKDQQVIYWVQEYLPFYQPLTFKKLASRLGFKVAPHATVPQPRFSESLALPRNPIGFSGNPRLPNILFIFIDSARADAMQPGVMPNLWAWKDDALWFQNHYSSGHGTGEGIFGALYGIPGTYFPRAIVKNKSAPLLDVLAALHYDFQILSCSDLHYPEFRQTAFVHWTNQIVDRWDGPRAARDQKMTDAFLQFLEERGREDRLAKPGPFFAFIFYDAAHQPYYCLPEFRLDPSDIAEPSLNYASIAVRPDPAEMKEMRRYYDNGLHYIDFEIGRLLQKLKEQHAYDNSIIIIAGDHGEEFGEHGRFGHVSSFNHFQTSPLTLARFPGGTPGIVTRLTSHVDFVPSVLHWMGATNEFSDYSTGLPLDEPNDRTYVLCSGRDRYVIIKTNSVASYDRYMGQYFDRDYHSISHADARAPTSTELMSAIREMGAFYK